MAGLPPVQLPSTTSGTGPNLATNTSNTRPSIPTTILNGSVSAPVLFAHGNLAPFMGFDPTRPPPVGHRPPIVNIPQIATPIPTPNFVPRTFLAGAFPPFPPPAVPLHQTSLRLTPPVHPQFRPVVTLPVVTQIGPIPVTQSAVPSAVHLNSGRRASDPDCIRSFPSTSTGQQRVNSIEQSSTQEDRRSNRNVASSGYDKKRRQAKVEVGGPLGRTKKLFKVTLIFGKRGVKIPRSIQIQMLPASNVLLGIYDSAPKICKFSFYATLVCYITSLLQYVFLDWYYRLVQQSRSTKLNRLKIGRLRVTVRMIVQVAAVTMRWAHKKEPKVRRRTITESSHRGVREEENRFGWSHRTADQIRLKETKTGRRVEIERRFPSDRRHLIRTELLTDTAPL